MCDTLKEAGESELSGTTIVMKVTFLWFGVNGYWGYHPKTELLEIMNGLATEIPVNPELNELLSFS